MILHEWDMSFEKFEGLLSSFLRKLTRTRINSFLSIQFNSNSNRIQNLSIQFQFNSFSFNSNSIELKFYVPNIKFLNCLSEKLVMMTRYLLSGMVHILTMLLTNVIWVEKGMNGGGNVLTILDER